jgi:class 3 adenylate cyclase
MYGLQDVREPIAVERRHAAVLFADLSGFTALVETAAPEVVYQRVRPLMDELVLLVDVHGGAIQQVLGDGFMSVFGLGSEPGDEVERAVRAGLALVSAGTDRSGGLPVHVGIECGEVLVSPSWEPARFAVWGRAVTAAKRLCDLAGPGTIHIGERAFELGARRVLDDWAGRVTSRRTNLEGMTGDAIVYSATVTSKAPHASVIRDRSRCIRPPGRASGR